MIVDGKKDHDNHNYVSRGALKLKFALGEFGIDAGNKVTLDIGCSTGGFTEVLLESGASRVYAVDTAYGQLDWKLRQNEKVIVRERTNALHYSPDEPVDLITVDAGWTAQKLIIPKVIDFLKPGGDIVSLVKPHYEARHYGIKFSGKKLSEADGQTVLAAVISDLERLNFKIKRYIKSPVTGEKGKNIEYFIWIHKKKN
jgi:23S rRNA (cytidine1920-2'-O)/16S rRNA (cytidine1409-2'-O)-methyltransferase